MIFPVNSGWIRRFGFVTMFAISAFWSEPMSSTITSRQPAFRVAGYQKWRDLLFLHWRVPADDVQRLLPRGLTVATFDGWAWVGLVAFDMLGVRPRWFPAIPGVSAFHETNVRTYVTRDRGEPGVWFFSLDAACSLAVRVARWRWHLNYYRANMRISRDGDRIAYSGRRLWPGEGNAGYTIDAETESGQPDRAAAAGSFEEFLVERYSLYVMQRTGTLLRGDVRHDPYPLRGATVTACDESLIAAAGLSVAGPPDHAVFSPGVDVKIGALEQISEMKEER